MHIAMCVVKDDKSNDKKLSQQFCQHDANDRYHLTHIWVICLERCSLDLLGFKKIKHFHSHMLWLLDVIALWLKFEHALKLDYIVFFRVGGVGGGVMCCLFDVFCGELAAPTQIHFDRWWKCVRPVPFFSPLFLSISICAALMSEIANLFGCGSE